MLTDSPLAPAPGSASASLPEGLHLGSCGQPCDKPCDEPCADHPAATGDSRWKKFLKASLFNTLDLCFDDVYAEPKTILIVGGCRQRDLAQHIALLLPAADIVVVDPDEQQVAKAKAEICCRFKFVHAPLEALPFEAGAFDLTIAHNFPAYPQANWQRALSEVCRVTGKNLMVSVHRPVLWSLLRRLPGFCPAMGQLGSVPPLHIPARAEWLTHLRLQAQIKTILTPPPWTVYMTAMKPDRIEKVTGG